MLLVLVRNHSLHRAELAELGGGGRNVGRRELFPLGSHGTNDGPRRVTRHFGRIKPPISVTIAGCSGRVHSANAAATKQTRWRSYLMDYFEFTIRIPKIRRPQFGIRTLFTRICMWNCPKCDESLYDTFAVCWRCGADRIPNDGSLSWRKDVDSAPCDDDNRRAKTHVK